MCDVRFATFVPIQSKIDFMAAVVTGASRGIGFAVAQRFAQAGLPVILVSRNIEALQTAREKLIAAGTSSDRVLVRPADIASPTQVDALCKVRLPQHHDIRHYSALELSNIGSVAHLVNAAGIAVDGLLATTSTAQIQAILDTNLLGTIFMCRGLARNMIKHRTGSIVNISSVIGTSTSSAGQTVYAASKAGIVGFSTSLAAELAPKGVRVNVIAPGFIETDMTAPISDTVRTKILARIPMARFGTAEEIADAVMFLSNASYVCGHTLTVDGGMTA
eukprot:jgi/Hompol1/5277/HPOL_004300-RA